jgi:hypothetical protein
MGERVRNYEVIKNNNLELSDKAFEKKKKKRHN